MKVRSPLATASALRWLHAEGRLQVTCPTQRITWGSHSVVPHRLLQQGRAYVTPARKNRAGGMSRSDDYVLTRPPLPCANLKERMVARHAVTLIREEAGWILHSRQRGQRGPETAPLGRVDGSEARRSSGGPRSSWENSGSGTGISQRFV